MRNRVASDSKTIAVIEDLNGFSFLLKEKAFGHIQEYHSRRNITIPKIRQALAEPCFIEISKMHPERRRLYYRLEGSQDDYLAVVVSHDDWENKGVEGAVITTIFPITRPKGGEKVYEAVPH